MSTALLRRRGVARVSGVLGVCALVSTGVVVSTTAASAEEDTVTGTLQTFAAEAFAPQADELPTGLVEAIQRDLGISAEEYLANAAAAKVAADVVAELEAAGVNINASAISGQDVTIYVEAEADVAAAEAVGATVKIGVPEKSDGLEEQELHPQDDFKGGYGYATVDDPEAPSSLYRCSAGLNGTSGGNPVNFTAGHCGYEFDEGHPMYHLPLDGPLFDSDSWTTGEFLDHPLGENGPMHFGAGEDGNDGGLLNITAPNWTPVPQVATWGGGTGAPDDGESVNVFDSTDAIVGQPACKSGATSGWTCGEVLFAEDTVQLSTEETVTAFIFTACMLSGDSGGAIVSGNYALGVDSFSTAATTATCDSSNWNPATEYQEGGFSDGDIGGGFAVTSGSANAETLFGDDYSLSIHVGTPAVTSPEDGATTGQTPTISGTVAAAEGATVSVAIEGGPTVEGTVGADGAWSAEVDETLEPGTYNYTATASHTANGASDVTTGGEATGSFEVVEKQVEDLAVDSPTEGQTTGNARPEFSGTGQPGATVTLSVGDADYGSAEVGEDGSWAIAPESDLPVGVRFDAVVTQSFEDDTQEVTVAGLGIEAAAVTVTAPEDGSTVAGDVNFEGTSFAGADIGLLLEQAAADAAGDDAQPRLGLRAEGQDDVEEWAGEFNIDDAGNWTFDPAEDLPEGDYTITAQASLEGGDPELSSSEAVASFTVSNGGGGDDSGNGDDGDEDLPDTGSSGTTWMVVGGIALLLAGGAAVAVRARRNTTA